MDLKVDLGNPKVMMRGHVIKDGLSKCRACQCGICSLRVKAK